MKFSEETDKAIAEARQIIKEHPDQFPEDMVDMFKGMLRKFGTDIDYGSAGVALLAFMGLVRAHPLLVLVSLDRTLVLLGAGLTLSSKVEGFDEVVEGIEDV